MAIRNANHADLSAVLSLLRDNGLPQDGVASWIENFKVAYAGASLIAVAGYERYAEYALLRSVVVDAEHRNAGVGNDLLQHILDELTEQNVRSVYLLTTTAAAYFQRRGFLPSSRASVPEALLVSEEFTHACPSSAQVMVRELE